MTGRKNEEAISPARKEVGRRDRDLTTLLVRDVCSESQLLIGLDEQVLGILSMTAELAVVTDTPLVVPRPHPGPIGLLAG